jgi:hypothetical protein
MSSIGKPVTEVERHWTEVEVEAVGCREHVRGFSLGFGCSLLLRHDGQRQTVELVFTSCRSGLVHVKHWNIFGVLMFVCFFPICGR